jgi:hypothetical protein
VSERYTFTSLQYEVYSTASPTCGGLYALSITSLTVLEFEDTVLLSVSRVHGIVTTAKFLSG